MTQHLRIALLALLIISLSACSTSTGGSGGLRSGEIAGNSSATLTGDLLGSATADVSVLRKDIAVTLLSSHPQLVLGTAYLTRQSETSEFASLIMPVSNTGTTALCFVKAGGLTYRQGSTDLTDGSGFSYADGSVGRTESGIYTSTCLDEGETGYLIDLPNRNWSDIDSLQIDSLSASDTVVSGHGGKLLPTNYSTDASGNLTAVTGANKGSITSYPSDFSIYILLDGAGAPLEWSFLDPPSSGSLSPGSSGTWTPFTFSYAGSTSRLRIHFDYDNEASASSFRAQGTTPLSRAEFLELREHRARTLNN